MEPGTPIGFKIVRTARMMLTELQDTHESLSPVLQAPVSTIFALYCVLYNYIIIIRTRTHRVEQCPHSLSCPMPQNSWCHFVQRIERMNLMKSAKSDVSTRNKLQTVAINRLRCADQSQLGE